MIFFLVLRMCPCVLVEVLQEWRKATEELLILNPWPSPNSTQLSGVCFLKRVIAKWRCLGLVEISSICLHFSRIWWQWWLWYGIILLGQRSLFQDTPQLVAQILFLGFYISVQLQVPLMFLSGTTSLHSAVIKLQLKQRKFALIVHLNSLAVSY